MHSCFVPPYLLRQLTQVEGLRPRGRSTLAVDEQMRAARRRGAELRTLPGGSGLRVVHDAEHTEELPGRVVRRRGDPATGDAAVDEAWESSGAVWDLFGSQFDREGMDGQGTAVSISVHYGVDYDNAFWDGTQLVFGDGDRVVFERFTKPADVMAHEFTHGVTQFSANLEYEGQSGALNESISDVFAAMTKQQMAGQTSAEADWLIGVGLFRPGIQARALRSMLDPGTAYDDPQLGQDPQVGSFSDYVDTEDDSGGVHINSGIANRAFALAARSLGGFSWEQAGRCWYDALVGPEVTTGTDFAGFATATLASADRLFGDDPTVASAVRGAWVEVGVLPEEGRGANPDADPGPGDATASTNEQFVAVRRTGGFAGIVRTGELDLAADPRGPRISQLLAAVDPVQLSTDADEADRFTYLLEYGHTRVSVSERALTPELHWVVRLVLGESI